MKLYFFLLRLLSPLARFVFRVTWRGTEHIPQSGPLIVCCNHRCVIDPLFLAAPFRRQVRYMAKSELFEDHGRLAAWLLNHLGAFPVERDKGDASSVRKALEILAQGGVLGIFPAGAGDFRHVAVPVQAGVCAAGGKVRRARAACEHLLQRGAAAVAQQGHGAVRHTHPGAGTARRGDGARCPAVCVRASERGNQRIVGGRPLKITVAKTAGFCFGVNRAVETVNRLLGEGERVWTLGPIIHNPQTLADLAARGVRIAQEPREAKGGVLVIRSHGVARAVLEEADRCGARVVDATCPFVAKIHSLVQRASREGRFVLIAGDAAHPEVQGIVGHCDGPYHVFSGAANLEKFSLENRNLQNQPVAVVSQTTFSLSEWKNSLKILKRVYTNAAILIQYVMLLQIVNLKQRRCHAPVTP